MLDGARFCRLHGTKPIDGLSQGVQSAADEGVADWNISRAAGSRDGGAFVQSLFTAQQDHTDGISFQV